LLDYEKCEKNQGPYLIYKQFTPLGTWEFFRRTGCTCPASCTRGAHGSAENCISWESRANQAFGQSADIHRADK